LRDDACHEVRQGQHSLLARHAQRLDAHGVGGDFLGADQERVARARRIGCFIYGKLPRPR
jgi:hypothetical protein